MVSDQRHDDEHLDDLEAWVHDLFDATPPGRIETAAELKAKITWLRETVDLARRVTALYYGAKPRHTYTAGGTHRDDCIPCGVLALATAVGDTKTAQWLTTQRDKADSRRGR